MAPDVLLIEDDAFLAESIRGLCSDLGYTCGVRATVADVEPDLGQAPPQYCIVDLGGAPI